MTAPRALVTGAAGQDGSYLTERLLAEGYAVHAIVRATDRGAMRETGQMSIHDVDLTDHARVRDVVLDVAPHEVYNLGGISSVAQSWSDPVGTAEVSGVAVVSLLQACLDLQNREGRPVRLLFTPHLVPMIRGIHSTLYARLRPGARDVDFQALYEARFRDEPFVDVMPRGSTPETRSVRASNMVRIAVHRPQGGDTLVILVVEDNLVKGASGQAVQVMNLMFGLPETLGLTQLPVLP